MGDGMERERNFQKQVLNGAQSVTGFQVGDCDGEPTAFKAVCTQVPSLECPLRAQLGLVSSSLQERLLGRRFSSYCLLSVDSPSSPSSFYPFIPNAHLAALSGFPNGRTTEHPRTMPICHDFYLIPT